MLIFNGKLLASGWFFMWSCNLNFSTLNNLCFKWDIAIFANCQANQELIYCLHSLPHQIFKFCLNLGKVYQWTIILGGKEYLSFYILLTTLIFLIPRNPLNQIVVFDLVNCCNDLLTFMNIQIKFLGAHFFCESNIRRNLDLL